MVLRRRCDIPWRWRCPRPLLFCAALVPGGALVAQSATLQGRISDALTAAPVPFAVVRVAGAGGSRIDTASADGRYVFQGLVSATYRVHVEASSYVEAEVQVTLDDGSRVSVDLALTRRARRATTLGRVLVRARRADACCLSRDDTAETNATDDERAPWRTGAGAERRAQGSLAQSGTLASAEPPAPGFDPARKTHALFVWGEAREQGRVTLDGIPLDVPLQVAGLLPPLDPRMIARTSVRTGGSPPRYDGGTAYIVDMTTRAPQRDSTASWGEVDALALRTGVETRLGNGAIAASVRRVNGELVQSLIGRAFGYASADGIVHGEWRAWTGRIRATAVGSTETVVIPRDQATDRSRWRNSAVAVSWNGGSERWLSTMTLTAGQGVVILPLLTISAGQLRTTANRVTAYAGGERQHGAWHATRGLSVEYLRVIAAAPAAPSDSTRCTTFVGCWTATAITPSAFAEWTRRIRARVLVSGGARLNGDLTSNAWHVLPRASVLLDVAPGLTAGLSVGRFSQVIADWSRADTSAIPAASPVRARGENTRLPTADAPLAFAGDVLLPSLARVSAPSLRPAHAWQLEAGMQWQGVGHRVTAVAAVRLLEGPDARLGSVAYSVDAGWTWWTRRATGAFEYGGAVISGDAPTAWSIRRARHVATGRLAIPVGNITAEFTALYSLGLPFTSIILERPTSPVPALGGGTVSDPIASPPTSDRLRVDAVLRARWRIGHGGRAFTLEPYAAVLNVLDRRDAVFYYRGAAGVQRPEALASLPLFASVGLRWFASRHRD